MPLVACPGCQTQLQLPDGMAGKQAKCPKCTSVFQIPAISATPQPMAPPPPAPNMGQQQAGNFDFNAPPPPGAPQPKARKKTSRVMLFSIIGVTVLFLAVVGFGGYYMVSWMMTGPASEMRYLPDDTNVIISFRVSDTLNSPAYEAIVKEYPEFQNGIDGSLGDNQNCTEFETEDISQALFGAVVNMEAPNSPPTFVMVMTFNKEVGLNDAFKGSAEKTEVGDYKIYTQGTEAMCSINDHTIVACNDVAVLESILKRNDSPKLSEEMKEAVAKVSWANSLVAVTDAGSDGASQIENVPFLPENNIKLLKKATPKSSSLELAFGSDVTIKLSNKFQSAEVAEDVRKLLDGLLTVMKYAAGSEDDVAALYADSESRVSGEQAILTWRFDTEAALNVANEIKGLIPMGPGGGPPPNKFKMP